MLSRKTAVLRRWAGSGIVALFIPGCSLAFTSAPQTYVHLSGPTRTCTTSKAAPVLDTLVTLPMAGATVVASAVSFTWDAQVPEGKIDEIGVVLWTATLIAGATTYAFGSSAKRGFENVRRCRRAHRLHDASKASGPQALGVFEPVGSVSQGPAWPQPSMRTGHDQSASASHLTPAER